MKKKELKYLLALTIFQARYWEEETRDLLDDAELDAAEIARITDKLMESQRLNDKRADEIRILTEGLADLRNGRT